MELTDTDRASLYITTSVSREIFNGSTEDPADIALDALSYWESKNAPIDMSDDDLATATNLGIKNGTFLRRMQRANA